MRKQSTAANTRTSIFSKPPDGVAFYDYDNDGWLDIFLVNGSRLRLSIRPGTCLTPLQNNRDGTFTDITTKLESRIQAGDKESALATTTTTVTMICS
jgi:hypothetical protein